MSEKSHNLAASNPKLLPPSAAKRSRNIALLALIFVACIAWIILTRLHTADEPLERDICTHIMMGRVLADGGRLYVDTIDFKPPGMFVIWQMIHQLAGTGPPVILWLNILTTILTLLGVFLAGSAKPWGLLGGLWAMGFWTLICGDLMLEANQPNNEMFMNMFTIWGVALWLRADSGPSGRWHYAAAGLLLGLVTLIKPVLATVVCMALAWVLAEGLNPAALKRRAWAMRWVLLPFAASWVFMLLYFVWQGQAGALYNCMVRYAVFYADSGDNHGTSSIWTNILRGLSDELIPPSMVFLIPLMALTILGIWGGWRGKQRSQALTISGCLAGTFLAVSIPGWFYRHYYQLYLPLLAVGAGWGIMTVANTLSQRVVARWAGAGTLLFLLWHIAPDYRFDGKTWSRLKYPNLRGLFIEVERCGRAVNQMLLPDEPFYAWGTDPGLYYYSDRRPASGIFWADRLLTGPLKEQTTRKVVADLEKTQPPLILVENFAYLQPPPNHPVRVWISQHYVRSPEARFSRLFAVYLRRDSDLAFRISTNQQPFVLTLADVDPVFLRLTSHELLQTGRVREAMGYLQKVMEIAPGHPEDDNDLAWLLATSSDADIRDGRRAVGLAEHACQLTDFKEINFVRTLAAAYAEAGRFPEAIATAQKACAMASASGKPEWPPFDQELLALYRAHQPYHEAANPDQTVSPAAVSSDPAPY